MDTHISWMPPRAASCFSGIGGAELALPEARWLWSAEVEPFANAVRDHHLDVPNLGDVLADDFLQRASAYGPLDLLIGGPPCQDFSVAGLRAGLDGARGNLTLRWVQVIHATRPRYAVTENVPGWFSVNGGHAFGAFLAALVGHDAALVPPKSAGGRWTNAGMVDGPGGRAAWRVLDAQYFGLAQRRQRVFVVFCAGDGDDPAAVLFEPTSLRGDTPPCRETGERPSNALTEPADRGGTNSEGQRLVADPICANEQRTYTHEGSTFRLRNCVRDEVTTNDTTGALNGGGGKPGQGYPAAQVGSLVRRLLPVECERLQGLPDGWTLVPWRGKPASDGPRYRAIGNGFAVSVVRWILLRVAQACEPAA